MSLKILVVSGRRATSPKRFDILQDDRDERNDEFQKPREGGPGKWHSESS